MANVIEEAVGEAVQAVKADVLAGVKNHPHYPQIVDGLVEKAVAALVSLVA